MKLCSRCKEMKSEDEFYSKWDAPDGLYPYCKECAKAAAKKWSRDNPEKRKIIRDRNRKSTPWQFDKYKSENQGKIKCRDTVNQLIDKGELIRKDCEICGKKRADAHHSDYSKPLQIKWLCHEHHMQL